jgi:opacity protein-like surface antigen
MKKVRLIAIALFVALLGIAIMLPVSAAAATAQPTATQANASGNPFNNVSVSGTFDGGTFSGTLHVQQFAAQNGNLVAVGKLSGTLTNTAGNVIGTVKNVKVALPTTFTVDPSCTILNLVLGPITLNLLGINVFVSQITITITAQQGTLLGNLLCSLVTTPPPTLQQIITILNEILALLGG